MGGGEVDGLVLLLAAGVVGVIALLAVRGRPHRGVVLVMVSLAFVPYWTGVNVGVYLPPASAATLAVVVALIGLRPARVRAPDAVVAAVVVLTMTGTVLGVVSIHSVFVVLAHWGLAYLAGRMLGDVVPLEWVYGAVVAVLVVAALLAVVEFATGVNPFVAIGPGSPLRSAWSTLQERGGILRAEGAFGHSIALGASCAMGIPLALGTSWPARRRLLACAALLAGAVVSFSRLGIGTAVLGLALVVCLQRGTLRTSVRVAAGAGLAAIAAVALPYVGAVFEAAGDEATDSATYRADLLGLVPSFRVLGTASSAERSADGVLRFGGFRSIDSAVIYSGLTYGWIITVLLCVLLVGVVVLVLTGRGTPPAMALAAQVPSLLTVALITQYAAFLWFVAGLAVCAHVARSRPAEDSPGPDEREVLGSASLVEPVTVTPAAGAVDLGRSRDPA